VRWFRYLEWINSARQTLGLIFHNIPLYNLLELIGFTMSWCCSEMVIQRATCLWRKLCTMSWCCSEMVIQRATCLWRKLCTVFRQYVQASTTDKYQECWWTTSSHVKVLPWMNSALPLWQEGGCAIDSWIIQIRALKAKHLHADSRIKFSTCPTTIF
jgi:hypothetical protein